MNTIKGTIIELFDTNQISEKFAKREVVIETPDDYPQTVIIQFTQTRTELLEPFQLGDDVKIHINIRGRKWENPQGEIKYFNSLEGWKIELVSNDDRSDFDQEERPYSDLEF